MAAGSPARPDLQKRRMIRVADVDVSGGNIRPLHLRVAAQAKIRVACDKHLLVDRAVGIVAGGATFAHRRMLENKRAHLVAMTLRAAFVLPRHRESVRRFQNVAAVRVMALHAIHVAFDHGMVLRQTEFRVDIEMALKAGCGVVVRIDDEFCAAAGLDVLAAGAVAGFAAGLADHRRIFKMDARVRAGGKFPDKVRVAIRAGLVAGVMRAGDFERHDDRTRHGGA